MNNQKMADGGNSWASNFVASEGLNVVQIHQVDEAGNVGAASTLSFTLDTAAPAAPNLALTQDSGVSAIDKVTNIGTLSVTAVETGANVGYSNNSGATWTSSFTAKEGANSVSVRQTDAAGNVSGVVTLNFTLDITPPQLNPSFSTGSQPIL